MNKPVLIPMIKFQDILIKQLFVLA